jgi:CII-binding regulator of phage lambda lysogenization HflD
MMNGDGSLKFKVKKLSIVFIAALFLGVSVFDTFAIYGDEVSDLEEEKIGLEEYLSGFSTQMNDLNTEISAIESDIILIQQKIDNNK